MTKRNTKQESGNEAAIYLIEVDMPQFGYHTSVRDLKHIAPILY